MPAISMATNADSVFIHIDKSAIQAEQLKQLIEFLRLNFADFSSVPEVSYEEQQELEIWLDSIPKADKEIAFSRWIEL